MTADYSSLFLDKTQQLIDKYRKRGYLTFPMKHFRIHIDINKFEQIYLHRHKFEVNLFEYCLN
jgi:hypothetical protein